jgi:hypothetical protein
MAVLGDLHVKYSAILPKVNPKLRSSDKRKKTPKYQISYKSVQSTSSSSNGRTEGRTDRPTELTDTHLHIFVMNRPQLFVNAEAVRALN